jgi:hypothetical protein
MSNGLLAPYRISLSLPPEEHMTRQAYFVLAGGFSSGLRLGQVHLVPLRVFSELLFRCTEYHISDVPTKRVDIE